MTLAKVKLWGRTIGAVSLEDGGSHAAFEYDQEFVRSGIEVSPLTMPLSNRVHVFAELATRTFHGLPGLLADSLPDRFGNALIDAWLATQGRTPESFNAIERLCDDEWQARWLHAGRLSRLREKCVNETRPRRGNH